MEADANYAEHGEPNDGTPASATDGLSARLNEQPKKNGVVDAGVQTELSGPPAKEQAS